MSSKYEIKMKNEKTEMISEKYNVKREARRILNLNPNLNLNRHPKGKLGLWLSLRLKYCRMAFFIFHFSLFILHPSLTAFAQSYSRKTNLPHVYINTFGNVGIWSKTEYVYATMHYVDEDDNVLQFDSLQIRGRGNSTWNMAKKPYRIKFHQKEKFLGKGYANAKNWTLLANAADKTMIRNAITSEMGDWLGLKFNPAHKFVDFTLNGTYQGTYQISDQIDVRPHRVNIVEQDYPLSSTSDITGGYLLEVDGFHESPCFRTNHNVYISIHYPDDDEIVNSQINYIRNYVNEFESALFSSNFTDPEEGYRAYVDSLSLINWFLATEISGNIDGYYSTYFYKNQQDPLLYFGPLWDYDIAYGNDWRKGDTSQMLMTDDGYGDTRFWMNQMWLDPWFSSKVNRRYREVVDGGIEDFLMQKIDSLVDLLQRSRELNYEKWGISTRVYNECVLHSSYDEYVADLKNYITRHIDYLRRAFANKKVFNPSDEFAYSTHFYHILNSSTNMAVDIYSPSQQVYNETHLPSAGALICSWTEDDNRLSQDWKITPVGNYYFIENRLAGLALSDPTEGAATATTNVGTQLQVAKADSTDARQLWTIATQGTSGRFNLINKHTAHAINLNSGGRNDGTSIISYTSDARNATSYNRQWYVSESVEIPGASAIPSVHSIDYALAYNPSSQTLHFGAEDMSQLRFTARVYALNGQLLLSFPASEECSLSQLPRGTYIVTWTEQGRTRSVKFQKQ